MWKLRELTVEHDDTESLASQLLENGYEHLVHTLGNQGSVANGLHLGGDGWVVKEVGARSKAPEHAIRVLVRGGQVKMRHSGIKLPQSSEVRNN